MITSFARLRLRGAHHTGAIAKGSVLMLEAGHFRETGACAGARTILSHLLACGMQPFLRATLRNWLWLQVMIADTERI